MGNSVGKHHVVFEEKPETWTLSVVEAIHDGYLRGNHDFGVSKEVLSALVMAVIPDAAENPVTTTIWRRFADYAHGASTGKVDDKARFCFRLFDFNATGLLTYDEVTMLVCTILTGTVLMTGRGTLPSDAALEPLIDEAFQHALKDVSAGLTADEFWEWSRDCLKRLCEKKRSILMAFGLLQPNTSSATEGRLDLHDDLAADDEPDTAFLQPSTPETVS